MMLTNNDNSEEQQIKNGQLQTARLQRNHYNATKMIRQQLEKESDTAIKMLIQLYESSEWQRVHDKPCKLYAMNKSGRMIAKASISLNATLQEIEDLIDCEKEYLPTTITENKTLEVGSYGELRYRFGKALWPIHHRDMVMVRAKSNDRNRLVVAFKSVNYDIPLQPGTIRVEIHVSGFVIEKISEEQCKYSNLANVQPKGAIPYFLKNKMIQMQGKMPLKFKSVLEKRKLQRLKQLHIKQQQTI